MIGRTISHYRIVSRLAAGGMGVVFRAEDTRLGRDVAIKFVSEDFTHDAHAMDRLRSEARAASALNHPNICTIYDVGEDEGRPYIVMEFMKGMSLRDRVLEGPVKVQQLVNIGIDVADALHAAHSEGIVHRDIKPGNLFLTERGHVKVLDFGLAKMAPGMTTQTTGGATYQPTEAGVTLGTVCYMSPEQATGEPLDGRTDIFSLGVVLYECATGHHPFPGKTSAVTIAGILTKIPVSPMALNTDVPPRLQEVIQNCLEKDRELRYQSAADLRADLKRVKRDLDSGRSQVVELASLGGTQRVAVSQADAGSGVRSSRQSDRRPTEPAAALPPPPPSTASGRAAWLTAAAVVVLLAGGGAWYIATRPATPANTSGEARQLLDRLDGAIADARRAEEAARAAEAAAARGTGPATPGPATPGSATPGSATPPPSSPAPQTPREPVRAVQPAPSPPPQSVMPAATPQAVPVTPPPVTVQPTSPTAPPVTPAPLPASPPELPLPAQAAGATPSPTAPNAAPPATPAPRIPSASAPAVPPAAPPPVPEPSAAARDEAAIRALVAAYGKAIEAKDIALFRTIKPNLSAEEQRRLQDGFRAVTSQRVELTIASITRQGDEASVIVRRRDTIVAGGRQQTAESEQRLAIARAATGWVIVNIR